MSEPPREFFTGTSLEQAVLVAAQHYGVEPDALNYERVERRYGFLRQRRNVVIKVDPKRPVRRRPAGDEQPPAPVEEIDDTPQLETQKDFNLHRDPPPVPINLRGPRPPAQRHGGQGGHRDGGGYRGDQGAQRAQPGQRGQGGRQGGQGQGGQGQGGQGEQRGFRGPRPSRGPAPTGPAPGGAARGGDRQEARGGEERGGRRRRRRRGGARQGGEHNRPVDAVAVDFVPEARNLPAAEGATAELAAATARQLAALAGLELEVQVLQGETELEVELAGPDQDLLFENDGRLLLAIQHLLPRSMEPATGGGAGVRVDSQGFRTQRVASLERLAREAAEEVRGRGRPKTLHSMNPSDRRVIHLTLKDAEGVVTESNGNGFFKRITVRPA